MQSPVVDLVPSGSHLGGFRQPVPSQNLTKTFVGTGEGECSGQQFSGSTEKLVSRAESYHCGFKRGVLIDDAELSSPSPKKRKSSVSDAGGNSSCSSELCTESNGCLVYVCRATDSSDRESIYSVQSKVTEIVKDSSDDLWFLEEDANSDQFSVDVYADEYEVVSENYSETDSDMDDILTSQEDVIVICEESDLEFFADCEWSNIDDDSSDDDLLQGDKWFCLTCQQMNGPLHRFCESCWTLRPNWLNKSSPKTLEHSEPFVDKDSVGLHLAEGDEGMHTDAKYDNRLDVQCSSNASDSQYTEQVNAELNHSAVSVGCCSVALECTGDSGIYRQELLPSSQDSGFGSLPSSVLSASQMHLATPTSSDVSLASFDASPRDRLSISNSTPDGEVQNLPVPPAVTALCRVPPGLCIICLSQPKDATIVHGTTGHQSSCYRCALRLKRRGKRCPVCRQVIEMVVRNYF